MSDIWRKSLYFPEFEVSSIGQIRRAPSYMEDAGQILLQTWARTSDGEGEWYVTIKQKLRNEVTVPVWQVTQDLSDDYEVRE